MKRKLPKLPTRLIFAALLFTAGGAGAAGVDCPGIKTPDELCNLYQATPALKNDQNAQKVFPHCKAFMQAAINTLNVLCQYNSDAAIADLGNQLLAQGKTLDQSGDLAAAQQISERADQLSLQYTRQANAALNAMDTAMTDSKKTLEWLAKDSAAVLKSELSCEGSGTAGRAPGALLMGLAKLSLEEQLEIQKSVHGTVSRFTTQLAALRGSYLITGQTLLQRAAAMAQTGATSTITGTPAAGSDAILDAAGVDPTAAQPTTAGSVASNQVSGKVQGKIKSVATEAVGEMAEGLGATAVAQVVRKFGGGVLDLATSQQVDCPKLLNIGIGLCVGLSDAPVAVVIGVGLATDYLENYLRNSGVRTRTEIMAPYLRWLKGGNLQPSDTSQQAAQSFQAQKKALDYCKTCTQQDLSQYCPANNEFNPSYNQVNSTNHPPGLQCWSKPPSGFPVNPACPTTEP